MDTLPNCPVCLRIFDEIVSPHTLHPCNHGICRQCLTQLEIRSITGRTDLKCPQCRVEVEDHKSNFDLKMITDSIKHKEDACSWVERLATYKKCENVFISEPMRKYAKLIVLRISFEDLLDVLADTDVEQWTVKEKILIKELKQELSEIICAHLDEDCETVIRWIKVLSFPLQVEKYLRVFVRRCFDNKEFLEEKDATWILDLFVQAV